MTPRNSRSGRATSWACEAAGVIAGFASSNPAAQMAALQLDAAAQACEEAAHRASMAPQSARAWAEQMVAGVRTSGNSVLRPGRPEGGGGSRRLPVAGGAVGKRSDGYSADEGRKPPESQSRWADPEALEIIRQKLPIRPGPLAKTHGVWIDADVRNTA
jgi:hypothetical protein